MILSLSESYKKKLKGLAGINENAAKNGLQIIMNLKPENFFKLIDLLEADITAYGYDDLNYYDQVTNIDVPDLLELYNQYGFLHHKYDATTALKRAYCQKSGLNWDEITTIADRSGL